MNMASRLRLAWAFALAAAVWLAARPAGAQTVGGPTVTPPYAGYVPTRLLPNGSNAPVRSQQLSPYAISYSDCIADQSLQFNLLLDGFDGSEFMEIWATATGDCTATTARGVGATAATCWQLQGGSQGKVIGIPTSLPFTLRVQDIIGSQTTIPAPGTPPVSSGADACTAQTTFVGVPITIWFLPTDSTHTVVGTAYSYALTSDTVGPPPPIGVGETVGDTLFNITWTPNADSDTVGYDVFMDPPRGVSDAAASSPLGVPTAVQYCLDSGTSSTTTTTTTDDDASSDATTSITTTSVADASCITIYTSGSNSSSLTNGGSCTSPNLSSGFSVSGTVTDEESGVVSSGGGISTVACTYAVDIAGDCYSAGNLTITGESTTSYPIKGLTNGTIYDVVVSAVDAVGNVGPPSSCVHDYPAPVNDFWDLYKGAGGKSGGSFCALDAVGLPVGSAGLAGGIGVGLLAAFRRRRRRAC
jgi:hypothetical protein